MALELPAPARVPAPGQAQAPVQARPLPPAPQQARRQGRQIVLPAQVPTRARASEELRRASATRGQAIAASREELSRAMKAAKAPLGPRR